MNLAYLIARLLRRYADAALRAQNTRLTYRNEDLVMEVERLERSRQELIDRAIRQDNRITELVAANALLQDWPGGWLRNRRQVICDWQQEVERRDSLDEDAAIERRNQAAEDRVAARDEDARKGWL